MSDAPRPPTRAKIFTDGYCPHDKRKCLLRGDKSPCTQGWCIREAGTDTHKRIDRLEDLILERTKAK